MRDARPGRAPRRIAARRAPAGAVRAAGRLALVRPLIATARRSPARPPAAAPRHSSARSQTATPRHPSAQPLAAAPRHSRGRPLAAAPRLSPAQPHAAASRHSAGRPPAAAPRLSPPRLQHPFECLAPGSPFVCSMSRIRRLRARFMRAPGHGLKLHVSPPHGRRRLPCHAGARSRPAAPHLGLTGPGWRAPARDSISRTDQAGGVRRRPARRRPAAARKAMSRTG